MLEKITDSDFQEIIDNSKTLVLVDFWAEWCGPCKMLTPILEQLAESSEMQEKVQIFKMNVDENPTTPSKLGVRGIPSLMLFKAGKLVDSKVGVTQLQTLKEWVESHS